jgi:predicted nuclease of predicted toxin-antitoxin system
MKLLLDQNLSFKLCHTLSDLFPGSTQVRLVGLVNATDRAVWDYAKINGFMLTSLDSDFAEMAALLGPPPKVHLAAVWQSADGRAGEPASQSGGHDCKL